MKAIILAGGFGTRISEETHLKPKPMVEIGGKPILWHIMKIYSYYDINEFIICSGYRGYVIKEYFANYFLHMSDITFDIKNNSMEVHKKRSEPWKITIVDTGEETMTGGRLKRVKDYVKDETFCFTYGDGVGNIDIGESIRLHYKNQSKATLTAVQPPGRYGTLMIKEDHVVQFKEKPEGNSAWINGGFFVLEPSVIEYIANDATSWEHYPLEQLAKENELSVYKHYGFWRPMDTLRDRNQLEELWECGQAPWRIW